MSGAADRCSDSERVRERYTHIYIERERKRGRERQRDRLKREREPNRLIFLLRKMTNQHLSNICVFWF